MSQFQFPCPKCQQPVLCEDEYRGMDLTCPHCSNQISAPSAPGKAGGKLGMTAAETPVHHPAPIVPMAAPRSKGIPGWVKPVAAALAACAAGAVLYLHPEYIKWAKVKVGLATPDAPVVTNAPVADAAADTNAVPVVTNSPPAVWSLALASASLPNYPAKGTIMGSDFTVDNARIDGTTLSLIQGAGAAMAREYIVYLKLQPGDTLEGQKFNVALEDTAGVPQLLKRWRDQPGRPLSSKKYVSGYAMKLEFGNIQNGKLPGKIYLSDPDDEHSFVAGTFEAVTKQPGTQTAYTQPVQTGQTNQPSSRRRNRQPGGAPQQRMPRPTLGGGNMIPL